MPMKAATVYSRITTKARPESFTITKKELAAALKKAFEEGERNCALENGLETEE